jgi:DNA-binding XRE family transcriptional regulator
MSAQIIEKDGKPAFAILPYEEWLRLVELAEDAEDNEAVRRFRAERPETYPAKIAYAIADGRNPIAVFRAYRGRTQRALAEAVGTTALYISQLERRDRQGSPKLLKAIAAALDAPLELLIEDGDGATTAP